MRSASGQLLPQLMEAFQASEYSEAAVNVTRSRELIQVIP